MIKAPATKVEFAYESIRREILDGSLKPHQRLRLIELAKRYDLSEMPVREALRMLQRDGLVIMHSHRGVTVAHLSWERAMEFVEVRTHLEVLAAVLATPRHTKQSLRGLEATIEKMVALAAKVGTRTRYTQLNRQFHAQLYAPCPNSVLKQEIESLWDRVWRARSQSIFEMDPDRIRGATQEHQDIFDAVKSEDTAAVEKAMIRHREATLAGWRAIARQSQATVKPQAS
jgi:DNA-binding GntR family transcriptional regulator